MPGTFFYTINVGNFCRLKYKVHAQTQKTLAIVKILLALEGFSN